MQEVNSMTAKKEILFVTFRGESFEDGLSYAIYLASMLGEELRVLLIGKNGFWDKFERAMTAAAFAEEGERGAAIGILEGPDPAMMQLRIREQCDKAVVKVTIHTRLSGSAAAIKESLAKPNIDMVLLSPNISKSPALIKSISKESQRPVVTITQWSGMAGTAAH